MEDKLATDDPRPTKSTGIPRISKLPTPSSSKLPLPRPSSLRPTPSRESLSGPSGNATLRNPKLRAAPSRDQLAPNVATTRSQPSAGPSRAVSSTHPRPSVNQAAENPPNRRLSRFGSSVVQQPKPGRTEGPSASSQGSRPSSVVRGIPRREAPQQWISGPSAGMEEDTMVDAPEEPNLKTTPRKPDSDVASQASTRSSSFKPRLSLAERTIETLSQLPSSPSVRGKGAASFYEGSASKRRSPSRPSSRSSRPGSSHHSEESSQGRRSAAGSRPGSSAGLDEGMSNFRASISAYKNPLATIESPLRSRKSIQSLQTPSTFGAGKGVRSSMHGLPSPTMSKITHSRTPSPEKRGPEVTVSKFGARTLAARPPAKRPSINGLFKKPSMPNLNRTAATETPRKVSTTSRGSSATSRDGSNPSGASVTSGSTAITSESADSASPQSARKSSSALREQIAKARAAKRAVSSQIASSDPLPEAGPESSLVPTDNTFDFGLASDPFNLRRDDQSQAKILQGRLESARTSGRLNIAAMGLREIPDIVMNMYNLEAGSPACASWAESVDLTRFVAADNELEMITDAIFPDVDPQEFANDEDSQGNIFAGLETLDLHGNMLIALPMGLRRLSQLTSLNLVSLDAIYGHTIANAL